MLLVIPSITIENGVCVGNIAYPLTQAETPSYENPIDRARLLRKENAKALHLIFRGDKEWTAPNLDLIEQIRQSVDIPIEVSLSTIPDDLNCVKQMLASGIYRLFLPHEASDYFVAHCISDFSRQKIAISVPIELAKKENLERMKTDGIIRLCITLPEERLPVDELRTIAVLANELGLRLSLLSGVHSYNELIQLSGLDPGFDSVILGSALDKNVFPCEGIWREIEIQASMNGAKEANLWKNPLAHISHI
jgi:phosphoribosylformimino-5-aminoimidazole carboxamide ribonucleotide (ProFAR) isomerase